MNDNSREVDFALASVDPLGKCTAEVKVSMPEELHAKLQTLATLEGVTLSAYMRDLCREHVFGRFHAVRMQVNRARRSSEHGPE